VTRKQPFLAGFPTTICGRIRRRLQEAIAAKRRAFRESSIASYALQFGHILPADFLHEHSSSKRQRHYCNVVVFRAWLAQIMEANASCSKAVSLVQAWCDEANVPRPAADTGAWCKARNRLKLDFLQVIRRRVNTYLNTRVRCEDKYKGLVVKSLDGSSVQLDDTVENQKSYPQPTSQQPGCGFPVMGIMGVLNHAHGGWEEFAVGPHTAHDAPVAHKLLGCFSGGDLICGDRAFCTYELISGIALRGAHSLMRLHQGRHRVLNFRCGKRIGRNQRLVTWTKPSKQPSASPLTEAQWAVLPATMRIRLIRFGYRDRDGKKRRMVLATTLLDEKQYHWDELAAIYAQRWDIELRLRDVKTTLGMEQLRVKHPETAHKTLEMTIIAYNLVKATCQQAAHEADEDIRRISFKGALDTLVANTSRYLGRQKQPHVIRRIWRSIVEMVAEKLIDLRPFRQEPRAIKRRPRSFSYLTCHRSIFKEIPHRGKRRSCA
jgi:hypothetical protein